MHLIQNLANRLSEEGKILQVKNNSLLSALTTGREVTGSLIEQSDINPNIIYKQLGDKLLNELSFYKNNLFPVLLDFKAELSSEMALQRDPVDEIFKVNEYSLPNCIDWLIANGSILENTNGERFYANQKATNFILKEEVETFEDVGGILFNGKLGEEDAVANEAFNKICPNPKSTLEFFDKYLKTIHGADEETYDKTVNHHVLMNNDFNCFENFESLFVIYHYVRALKESNCKSNLPLEERNSFLSDIEKELLSAMQAGYNYYRKLIENSVVRYAKINSDGSYDLLVFTENFNIFADKSAEDAWSAVYGSHPLLVRDNGDKLFKNIYSVTVDELLLNESKLIKGLERFRLIEETKLRNEIITNVKRSIKKIAERFYRDIVKENLEEYCSYKTEDEFSKALDEYLATKNDNEMSFTSSILVVEIVCGILFNKTNFLSFAKDTSGEGLFNSYIDVKDESLISVAAISLLSNRLIESIEIISKND